MRESEVRKPSLHRNLLIAATPVLLALLQGVLALKAPRFYQTYVQDISYGEFKLVELCTVAFALSASGMLLYCAVRLARHGDGSNWGVMVFAGMSAGCLFLAGEEINWGQVWAGWGSTPADIGMEYVRNLHNNDSGNAVENLGVLSLLLVFFWLPLLSRTRVRQYLPKGIEIIVPDFPLAFAMVFSIAFEGDLLRLPFVQGPLADATGWNLEIMRFHINETKELMVTLVLLMYARSRVTAIQEKLEG
jgi:hypothetical protein